MSILILFIHQKSTRSAYAIAYGKLKDFYMLFFGTGGIRRNKLNLILILINK